MPGTRRVRGLSPPPRFRENAFLWLPLRKERRCFDGCSRSPCSASPLSPRRLRTRTSTASPAPNAGRACSTTRRATAGRSPTKSSRHWRSRRTRPSPTGAGTGYFAVRLARAVPKGRVFAVDIEPDMVRYLLERAKREGVPNLRPVLGKPDDPQLPEPVDRVLIVDTYHHIGNRVAYFERLRARLAPGGAVAIVDFTLDSPVGPPRSARIAADAVRAEMQRAGYALAAQHDFLPHQYFLVFRPR
ncbi:MAG: class I SAM-dependent methyltransferase [Burkholderiaceae bacterium]